MEEIKIDTASLANRLKTITSSKAPRDGKDGKPFTESDFNFWLKWFKEQNPNQAFLIDSFASWHGPMIWANKVDLVKHIVQKLKEQENAT